jgi:hypothetical protein
MAFKLTYLIYICLIQTLFLISAHNQAKSPFNGREQAKKSENFGIFKGFFDN